MNQVEEELEMQLIGTLIIYPEKYIDFVMALYPDDFEMPECKEIFNACITLFAKGIKIDALTVVSEINREKDYFKTFIYNCGQLVTSTANLKHHMQLLSDKSKLRKLKDKTAELFDEISITSDLEVCRIRATELLKIFDGVGIDETISSASGYNNFINNAKNVKEYVKTGIEKLDKYCKFSKGDFIGIGGRPSSGKTAFSLQLMLNMARTQKVVYFSLETTAEKLIERMISNYTSVKYDTIREGGMKDEDIQTIKDICNNRFGNLNFNVVGAAGWSVERIRSKALQLKADVIFIDYLGIIRAVNGKSIYERVTNISIDLHTMAQMDKILVISLIQLNRGGAGEPTMESLRDSGQTEQDCDCIIMLSLPDKEEKTEVLLNVVKNKDGICGKMLFDFQGDIQKFRSIE